jgi:hypothetical protein
VVLGATTAEVARRQADGTYARSASNEAWRRDPAAADTYGAGITRPKLGLPGLEEGAPVDVVAYPADPCQDLGVSEQPVRVILRGRMVR